MGCSARSPVLFAVFPLFVLFAHNQTAVERAELWRPLAICVISAMALYGLFAIVFGNGPKAGALASLVVVAFYFYGSDARQVSGWGLGRGWFDALWLALLVLGVVALVRTTRDPYIFGEHGQAVAFPNRSDEALGSRRGMRFYLRQLKFVNTKLIDVVDAIRARSKRPPVIVIQSDEGFQGNPDDFGEAAMQDIRIKGLTALYLPGVGRAGVPQPPNTVNTLRFVFNQYLGTRYKLLRSASYPELDLPYQFKEMSVR